MASSRVGQDDRLDGVVLRFYVLNNGDAVGKGFAGAGGGLGDDVLPGIMGGMQPAWTGVVTSSSRRWMARMISGDRPRLSNRTPSVYSINISSFHVVGAYDKMDAGP